MLQYGPTCTVWRPSSTLSPKRSHAYRGRIGAIRARRRCQASDHVTGLSPSTVAPVLHCILSVMAENDWIMSRFPTPTQHYQQTCRMKSSQQGPSLLELVAAACPCPYRISSRCGQLCFQGPGLRSPESLAETSSCLRSSAGGEIGLICCIRCRLGEKRRRLIRPWFSSRDASADLPRRVRDRA